ncbi:MAG: helix-turn-helix domain-containing protein [Bernardetiaceae bacterium]|jgi:transcriptional regulator with XRE-family HTH domain|nr:helix-turn-helix domain-containing protein [Bernardetiaceae bacterium]
MAEIHANLRALRKSLKLTQKKVATSLIMSQRAYADLETGRTPLSIDRLVALSKLIGMDPPSLLAQLLELEPPKPKEDPERDLLVKMMKRMTDSQAILLKEFQRKLKPKPPEPPTGEA